MRIFKYFIYYQSTDRYNIKDDNNRIVITNKLILDDLQIQSIQNEILLSLKDCDKVVIKNFILLHEINKNPYGDYK
jgi:hypothetical protein